MNSPLAATPDFTRRLLLITLLESLGTICLERGIYFFSNQQLHFSGMENLWLALAWGVLYVAGAMGSHRLSQWVKEGPLLALTIFGQLLCHSGMIWWATGAWGLTLGFVAVAFLNGTKWPLLESYVSAGKTPSQAARSIGQFNVSWAISVPLALFLTGPILTSPMPWGIFLLPAAINAVCLFLLRPLPLRPVHLPADHPERPNADLLRRIRGLTSSSRWLMFCSYCAMFILAALMPDILDKLNVSKSIAPGYSGVLDIVRVLAFVILQLYVGWHWRVSPLAAAMVGLPVGFFLILFGGSLGAVLGGEIVFGLAMGMTYYAALYYAIVEKNASVDAGGAHESLIGLGMGLGPAAGILAEWLSPTAAGWSLTAQLGLPPKILATLIGIGPIFILCTAFAIRALVRMAWEARRTNHTNSPGAQHSPQSRRSLR